jgi:DNA polymerase-3 subunit delta
VVLDFRKLQQRLETKEPAPLYVLMGEETFLVQESVALIKARSVDPGTLDFNCDIFDAGDVSASDVRDAAEMLPMMSPRRLVVFRGVDDLKDKDWEVLYPVIENPPDTTTFVLTCEGLDKRKKFYKKLLETAVVVELKRPYENHIPDWIDYLAFRHDLKVAREAAQLLRQFVGVNLTELNNELVKLKDYLGERSEITAQDVLAIVSQSRVDRVFDFTDAIGKRDRASALHTLANLLEHGQNEVGILAMVTRHFRILRELKEGQKEGLSGQRLSSKAGIPQFLLSQYLEQIRRWNETEIQATFSVLLDTDRALKSSNLPAHLWLENLVLKTCS